MSSVATSEGRTMLDSGTTKRLDNRTTIPVPAVLLSVILVLAPAQVANAQSPGSGMVFSFPVSIPLGEYGENVGTAIGVIDFSWLWGLEGIPVAVGANIGYILHSRTELHGEIESRSVPFHVVVRVQPREGRLRPYLDGLVGTRRISLSEDLGDTCVGIPAVGQFCSPIEDVFQSDWTYSVGAGGGVQIPLGGDWAFDAGARFLYGGRAQYVVDGSLRADGDLLFFDVATSDTPIVMIQFGFGLLY